MLNRSRLRAVLQRACSCDGATGDCSACAEKKEETLHRYAANGAEPEGIPPIVHEVLSSPGSPLDAATRAFMESRFGYDFGGVRIHTGAKASSSAQAVNAVAYTVGNNIVLANGSGVSTAAGRKLLAHELTHVIQDGGGGTSAAPTAISSPSDHREQEAERVSQSVLASPIAAPSRTTINAPVVGTEARRGLPTGASQYRGFPALGITSASATGVHKLSRATYRVGALSILVDYSDIIYVTASNYQPVIETLFTSWTGAPATTISPALTALTDDQRKWVLYGLDILVDNTAASHSAFNRAQGVQRLIAHAPSATTQPLSGPFADYANEVLRVSGWFEVALAARLTAPTGADLTAVRGLFRPPPGPTAAAGGALDVSRLNTELPPALTALLNRIDPLNWSSVGTQSLGTLQSIGDLIQAEARGLFAPYADTAIRNAYARNWVYSANISSTVTIVPTTPLRINYLLNRAEIVGRQSQSGGAIFDNCNYDSSRPADRAALLALVTTMEAISALQPVVDRLIQHTGRTTPTPAGPQVRISTEFDLGSMTECQARWSSIDTLTHELIHAMVHPSFPAAAATVGFGQIIREGFTEVLGVQLYQYVRARAGANATFKGQLEAGVSGAPCPVPAAATIGYGQAGTNAEAIRARVGNDNFRAAYFLGALNLVGL
jgi:hypothetical protein